MTESHLIYEPEDVIYVMAEGGNVRAYEVQEDGSLAELGPVER